MHDNDTRLQAERDRIASDHAAIGRTVEDDPCGCESCDPLGALLAQCRAALMLGAEFAPDAVAEFDLCDAVSAIDDYQKGN